MWNFSKTCSDHICIKTREAVKLYKRITVLRLRTCVLSEKKIFAQTISENINEKK